MPPRWLCFLIVFFWLASTAWLFWRDLLPQLLPGQPPPFTIDPVEEAQTQRPYSHWTVYRDGRKALAVRMQVKKPGRDLFELTAQYDLPMKNDVVLIDGALLRKMTSTYRVNSRGDLLAIHVHMEGVAQPPQPLLRGESAVVDGEVKNGRLDLGQTVALANRVQQRLPLPDVAAPGGMAVLLALHPVQRLRGLSPGQTWRLTALDPLPALGGVGVKTTFARAEVRPQVEEYSHGRYVDVPCLVIDCKGDDLETTTWVREKDGLVLCHEATLGKTRWTLYRD
jgi:hypothetical protein